MDTIIQKSIRYIHRHLSELLLWFKRVGISGYVLFSFELWILNQNSSVVLWKVGRRNCFKCYSVIPCFLELWNKRSTKFCFGWALESIIKLIWLDWASFIIFVKVSRNFLFLLWLSIEYWAHRRNCDMDIVPQTKGFSDDDLLLKRHLTINHLLWSSSHLSSFSLQTAHSLFSPLVSH